MCELCPLICLSACFPEQGFRALEGSAFFALRSCHQILGGDSGEFFSPDYLCSSPALWCNWTIQVPRGKRVKLYLEDLTPDYTCHLKMDQIHLDESPVAAGGAQILERCWQSARYTSISNTVHVVQLIGPNPNPPHRGFYAQYQAFGPVEPPPAPTVGGECVGRWGEGGWVVLSDGVLLILWVQFGSGQNEELQSTLQNLKGKSIKPHGANSHGTVSSISVEDINECETRLVMCDVNAECVNEFGSYSCHCLHGYSPGLGGAMCVDPKTEDCSRASFPELLYVVCVLLGFLIALLLLVLGVIYRRYHRGAFLPHCHSSSTRSFTAAASDANNNSNSDCGLNGGSDPCSSRPLPPPPPLRLPREPPNSLDLPLLKFTPLAPSGGFEAKLQSEKDKL
uniref:EGF-like domain-containing protein n=1 Tax=Astyanax mexicanus TaxID=7994 RepID=A0A3B1IE69_ASTMX